MTIDFAGPGNGFYFGDFPLDSAGPGGAAFSPVTDLVGAGPCFLGVVILLSLPLGEFTKRFMNCKRLGLGVFGFCRRCGKTLQLGAS